MISRRSFIKTISVITGSVAVGYIPSFTPAPQKMIRLVRYESFPSVESSLSEGIAPVGRMLKKTIRWVSQQELKEMHII